jgi:hypothetical protein
MAERHRKQKRPDATSPSREHSGDEQKVTQLFAAMYRTPTAKKLASTSEMVVTS